MGGSSGACMIGGVDRLNYVALISILLLRFIFYLQKRTMSSVEICNDIDLFPIGISF
jgi:hypothetical protein